MNRVYNHGVEVYLLFNALKVATTTLTHLDLEIHIHVFIEKCQTPDSISCSLPCATM